MPSELQLSLGMGLPPMELVRIPAGEFEMGTENQFFSEAPPHRVLIARHFFLAKYPVTQAQWLGVMGANPSEFRESLEYPVDSISWDQAVAFCDHLRVLSGHPVRLPSEAEWEYACRAGTTDDYFFGPWGPLADPSEVRVEMWRALSDYAWFDMNSRDSTRSVGLKRPNPWGLHDMIGNVWEWCADVWHSDYTGAPNDGTPWLEGDSRQPRRCLRGGAWDMNAFRCRSSYRSYDHRDVAMNRFGVRVLVDSRYTATMRQEPRES